MGPSGCGKSTLLDMIADVKTDPELGLGIFIGQVLQGLIASLVVQGALQKRVKSEKDFDVYQNQLTACRRRERDMYIR